MTAPWLCEVYVENRDNFDGSLLTPVLFQFHCAFAMMRLTSSMLEIPGNLVELCPNQIVDS